VIELVPLQIFLAMLRPAGMMIIAPLFSANYFPLLLRSFLCILFAIFVQPNPTGQSLPVSFANIDFGYIVGELMIGFTIGFVLQTGFAAALMGGELISNMMGLGFAANFESSVRQNTAILGHLFSILLMLTFLMLDGHLFLFGLLADSMVVVPPGMVSLTSTSLRLVLDFALETFLQGILLALPMCVFLFAVNLVLSVLARMTPQLNLFALGMPFTVSAGTVFLLFALPYIFEYLGVIVTDSLDQTALILTGFSLE
jgi:flagellar biosynthetic protein FliR